MTWIFTYRRVLSNQSEFLFRRMDQGNRTLLPGPTKPPRWNFFQSRSILNLVNGLSGTFYVAASKRSYQVFVVSVFRDEFFATVCSFLPVFKAIVTENVTKFRFRPS